MHNYWNYFMQGGDMGAMIWWGLAWIILLIVVIYLIVKIFSNGTGTRTDKETPLEILQKEYAKGNITEEEYLKRKKLLE